MIIEINDRVAVRRVQAYRNGLRLSVSARKRIARNPSHATMISAYRFRSLCLHVTPDRLAYMRTSYCVNDRRILSSTRFFFNVAKRKVFDTIAFFISFLLKLIHYLLLCNKVKDTDKCTQLYAENLMKM